VAHYKLSFKINVLLELPRGNKHIQLLEHIVGLHLRESLLFLLLQLVAVLVLEALVLVAVVV